MLNVISVIIPAYNAQGTIKDCLDSLMAQDYSGEYEIIVVDDGSTDMTPAIISGYKKVKLIRQANAGPAAARNRGAAEAKGEIILFTDSDCVPERNWVRMMLEPFRQDNYIVGVKGVYRTKQRGFVARFVQLEYEDKYKKMQKDRAIDFIDTYSAAFKKDIFHKMGGYDTSFPVACAEDIELSYRIAAQGHVMVFNPKAVVYHIHPDRLSSYLKKKYKFAFWRILAVKKNPRKIVRDSHTPQLTKVGLMLVPFVDLWALTYPFSQWTPFLAVPVLYSAIISIPVIKFIRKDYQVGVVSPLYIFLRDNFQLIGLIGGCLKIVQEIFLKRD